MSAFRSHAGFTACAAVVVAVGVAGAPDAQAQPGARPAATVALQRSATVYRAGPVALTRADGKRVMLDDELAFDGPVALNFVFTTCSTVCPIASRTFAELQARPRGGKPLRLLSISLDPLNDTPAVLRAYAAKFGAGPEWRFYTGTVEASAAAQRAFDLYRGDKMNHAPITLVRSAPNRPWLRLEGFPTAAQLAAELDDATPVARADPQAK
jgi:protein SCO1/2